ncbi:hypothetical protein G6F36_011642 [Rhizopus arrhizus]|nr:hypothetical protein G6F36_011642 [Rhizopus arrhizus]
MCTGYVVFNDSSQDINYKQSTHPIPWNEKRGQVDYISWRTKTIRQLQSDQNRLLHSKPPLDVRLQNLPVLDKQIEQEADETLTKYLKKLYRQHMIGQHITNICPHDSADPVEDIDQLLPIAQQFYRPLHFTDTVDDRAVNSYLDNIQDLSRLNEDHTDSLLEPITIEETIHETTQVQNKVSSPREDGLRYAFLYQLFQCLPLQELVLKAFDQILYSHTFPTSWQELRITRLKNW